MNIEDLNKSNYKIYEYIGGSHAYGTANEHSDIDIRGIFQLPKESLISIIDPPQEISNESQDIKYFELKKFVRLAAENNPNIIEAFYIPSDCVKFKTKQMDFLIDNAQHFLSRRAIITHLAYAHAQINKSAGQKKLVVNPKPEAPPKREDFCYIINIEEYAYKKYDYEMDVPKTPSNDFWFNNNFPCRPIPLNESGLDLKDYHVSALEHVPNTYRLYAYGRESKGVFNNYMVLCQSIPKEDEWEKFAGFLIFNEHEYEKAMRDWKHYWDWVHNRNEKRWSKMESGELNYDTKNMMHCYRLLFEGENIIKHGRPLVRMPDDKLAFLKQIRNGLYTLDYILKDTKEKMDLLEKEKESCSLPYSCDMNKVNEIFLECYNI